MKLSSKQFERASLSALLWPLLTGSTLSWTQTGYWYIYDNPNNGLQYSSYPDITFQVMNRGQVKEFGSPYNLLQDHRSLFYKMVQKTGPSASKKLQQMALDAHLSRKSKLWTIQFPISYEIRFVKFYWFYLFSLCMIYALVIIIKFLWWNVTKLELELS